MTPTTVRRTLRGWFGTWRPGRDPARFLHAVRDTIAHRLREREVDARTIGWDEHWRIRRHTIAVAPYVWCRSITRNLDWPDDTDHALRDSGVIALAAEAVARANDLASHQREALPTPGLDRPLSLNSVLHYARDLGDLDAAVATARDACGETVQRLEAAFWSLRHAGLEPDAEHHLEIVAATVNGNLDALAQLSATRYRGSARLLENLPRTTLPVTKGSPP
jgi:hypothetical protein